MGRFVRGNNKRVAVTINIFIMECCYATQLLLFLTTLLQSHSNVVSFSRFTLSRSSDLAPTAILIFIKFDIPSFCARIIFMDAICGNVCASIRNEGLSWTHTWGWREPQPDCKAIVPFRKSNPFLAVTIDDDHSFWLNRSECFGGSVLIWDPHLCIRKQLSLNVANNYLLSRRDNTIF